MKKILFILGLTILSITPTFAINEELLDGAQVKYSPQNKIWTVVGNNPEYIIYTKKTTSGTGSYSEYYTLDKTEPEFVLSSNYEFVRNGKLIAVINKDLKFAQVINKNGKIHEKELSKGEIEKLFPDTKIIKISSFKKHKITLKPKKFPQQYLLWNNTDKNFHKYSITPYNTDRPYINGAFRVDKEGEFIFSHFGKDPYKIIIK